MARRLMVAVSDRVCPQVDAELAREREQLERQRQQKLRARQDAARLAEQQAGELEAAQRKRAEMERQLAERQAETERMGGDVESIASWRMSSYVDRVDSRRTRTRDGEPNARPYREDSSSSGWVMQGRPPGLWAGPLPRIAAKTAPCASRRPLS